MDPELELGLVAIDFPGSGGLGFDFRLRKCLNENYSLRAAHGHYETGGIIGELEFKLNLDQIKELGEMFLRAYSEEINKNKKEPEFKFNIEDNVNVISFVGVVMPGIIKERYVHCRDILNKLDDTHVRYKVLAFHLNKYKIYDLSENEMELMEEQPQGFIKFGEFNKIEKAKEVKPSPFCLESDENPK